MEQNTCNYVYLISKYLIAILQVLDITLSDSYSNNLINTKCLNTAVMIIVILIGKNKVPVIQYCDVGNTTRRHLQSIDRNDILTDKLINSVCRVAKTPYVYYIMMTDGNLNHKSTNQTKYFPGHVFILEKTTNKEYLLYQSYIGKYDLNDYVAKNKCKKYSLKEVKKVLEFFKKFLSVDYVWDVEAVRYWIKLTGVDTKEFEGYKSNNIYLCFQKFKLDDVNKRIKLFAKKSLNEIKLNIKNGLLDTYHSNHHYYNKLSAKGYSIHELKNEFDKLNKELNSI